MYVTPVHLYSPVAFRKGTFFSKILLSIWKQISFEITGIPIEKCRQTGPHRTGSGSFLTANVVYHQRTGRL